MSALEPERGQDDPGDGQGAPSQSGALCSSCAIRQGALDLEGVAS
jgi:hypothetical protein